MQRYCAKLCDHLVNHGDPFVGFDLARAGASRQCRSFDALSALANNEGVRKAV